MIKIAIALTLAALNINYVPIANAQSALFAQSHQDAYLRTNQRLVSNNGQYVLVMQSDGNLVIYKAQCVADPNCAIWNSESVSREGSYVLAAQKDGNVVVYREPLSSNDVIWDSGTFASPNHYSDYVLFLQNNGVLVMYKGNSLSSLGTKIWSSTNGKKGTMHRQQGHDN